MIDDDLEHCYQIDEEDDDDRHVNIDHLLISRMTIQMIQSPQVAAIMKASPMKLVKP